MSNTTSIVRSLLEKGRTDLALKEFEKNISIINKDVLSALKIRYVNYNKEVMMGTLEDGKELNRINAGLLGLLRLEEETEFENSTDYDALATELGTLKQEMNQQSTSVQHDAAVKDIENAEEAAKASDTPGVIKYLKSAGQWALDVAVKIGTAVATEAINKALGIK